MIDFEKRLKSLKERRQGTKDQAIFDSMESFSANRAVLSGIDFRKSESYETLKESVGVRYTIGAMAAVERESTQISINEGNRVADSLIKSLSNNGESVTKRLQGSVALDVHIKGHSDVDMLIIVTNPVNIELPEVNPSYYSSSTDARSLINIIKDVRTKSEKILPLNFPAANIDCSSRKCISLSGGSLKRKIDIIPAIWFDSRAYQQSRQEYDRGIKIYDKVDHQFLLNFPFLHIKRVNERDEIYSGNLKCVIRLLKNMIADMPDYKKNVAQRLSSYDLTAIAYHMNQNLQSQSYMRLGLVEKTRSHLSLLVASKVYRDSLIVPDGTRTIFNDDAKTEALEILSREIDDLATSIYKELKPFSSQYDPSAILQKAIF